MAVSSDSGGAANEQPENDPVSDSPEASGNMVYVKDDDGNFTPLSIDASDPELPDRLVLAAQQNYHSGPLPSVETFRAYGEVVSTAPERILGMAEKEQDAAHEFSRTALSHEKSLVSQGHLLGFASMMVALCGGIYLAVIGQTVVACALVSPAVLTPIMRFYFKGRHEAQKDEG